MKRRISQSIICILFSLLALPAIAQSNDKKLEKANKLYEELAYADAAELYEEVLYQIEDKSAMARLGYCYRVLENYEGAERWFGKAVEAGAEGEAVLYFAQALQSNQKYADALRYFKEYQNIDPTDERASFGVEACENVDALRGRSQLFTILNLPINSEDTDFGPAFFNDGLAFTSDRKTGRKGGKIFAGRNKPFNNVFFSAGKARSWSDVVQISSGNTKYHDGPAQFNKQGNKMFLSRSEFDPNSVGGVKKDKNKVVTTKIVVADLKSGGSDPEKMKWNKGVELPFNSEEHSIKQATVTEDGRTMYFVGDEVFGNKYGGQGGSDIYVTRKEGNTWSRPENLGAPVNTSGDELSPFIQNDSVLYFSSDAHPGLGGLDVFRATKSSNDYGSVYGNIYNMGMPINSSVDDFGFILNKKGSHGYLATNRKGGRGADDIWEVTFNQIFVEILTYDKLTGKPVGNADVKVSTKNGVFMQESTNMVGLTSTVPAAKNEKFLVDVTASGYNPAKITFNTEGKKGGEVVRVRVPLESGAAALALEGMVKDQNTGAPIADADVVLENRTTGARLTAITEADGRYTFPVEPDNDYRLTGKKQLYFPAIVDFNTNGVYSGKVRKDLELRPLGVEPPVKPGKGTPTGTYIQEYEAGIVLYHIYYDFDKHYITNPSSVDLHRLLEFLKQDPTAKLEINSHADARGSYDYNVDLTIRRANAVKEWLTSRGISASRLMTKGWGENYPLNDCYNGIDCNEDEHQRNRRTEFTLRGYQGFDYVSDEKPRYMRGKYADPGTHVIEGASVSQDCNPFGSVSTSGYQNATSTGTYAAPASNSNGTYRNGNYYQNGGVMQGGSTTTKPKYNTRRY